MKNLFKFTLIAPVLILAVACTSKKDETHKIISQLEGSLFSDESRMIDRAKAKELIDVYIGFADDYPNDPVAPDYLFRAGDMAMNMNMPYRAIEVFDRIMNNYPDFEKAPQCLFLKGYIYENDLKDLNAAKKIYEEFLQKYPDDEFADDAEISIKNLGKTPEQLIKEFEEQAKKQGAI